MLVTYLFDRGIRLILSPFWRWQMAVSQLFAKAVNSIKRSRELLPQPKRLLKRSRLLLKRWVASLGSSRRKSPSPQQLQLRPKQKRQRPKFGMKVELWLIWRRISRSSSGFSNSLQTTFEKKKRSLKLFMTQVRTSWSRR